MIYIMTRASNDSVVKIIEDGTFREILNERRTAFITDYSDSFGSTNILLFKYNNRIYKTYGILNDEEVYDDLEPYQIGLGYYTHIINKDKRKVCFNGTINVFGDSTFYKGTFHYTPHILDECTEIIDIHDY